MSNLHAVTADTTTSTCRIQCPVPGVIEYRCSIEKTANVTCVPDRCAAAVVLGANVTSVDNTCITATVAAFLPGSACENATCTAARWFRQCKPVTGGGAAADDSVALSDPIVCWYACDVAGVMTPVTTVLSRCEQHWVTGGDDASAGSGDADDSPSAWAWATLGIGVFMMLCLCALMFACYHWEIPSYVRTVYVYRRQPLAEVTADTVIQNRVSMTTA